MDSKTSEEQMIKDCCTCYWEPKWNDNPPYLCRKIGSVKGFCHLNLQKNCESIVGVLYENGYIMNCIDWKRKNGSKRKTI